MFDDVAHSAVLYQTDDNKYHIIESFVDGDGVKQTEVNLTIEKTNEKSCHYLINGEKWKGQRYGKDISQTYTPDKLYEMAENSVQANGGKYKLLARRENRNVCHTTQEYLMSNIPEIKKNVSHLVPLNQLADLLYENLHSKINLIDFSLPTIITNGFDSIRLGTNAMSQIQMIGQGKLLAEQTLKDIRKINKQIHDSNQEFNTLDQNISVSFEKINENKNLARIWIPGNGPLIKNLRLIFDPPVLQSSETQTPVQALISKSVTQTNYTPPPPQAPVFSNVSVSGNNNSGFIILIPLISIAIPMSCSLM